MSSRSSDSRTCDRSFPPAPVSIDWRAHIETPSSTLLKENISSDSLGRASMLAVHEDIAGCAGHCGKFGGGWLPESSSAAAPQPNGSCHFFCDELALSFLPPASLHQQRPLRTTKPSSFPLASASSQRFGSINHRSIGPFDAMSSA